MKIFRSILCVLLLCAMMFLPHWLVPLAKRDFFAELRKREPPAFSGTVVLYHIVSERTFSGSVTNWLQLQAEAYEKKHKGTHILVEGMTKERFWERIAYGRVPDGYSFFSGTMYPERLQKIEVENVRLRDGLFDTAYAVPYCYSGYAALYREQDRAPMPELRTIAAQMATEEIGEDAVITDLRSAGDALRNEQFGASYTLDAAGNFTDQVLWLGVDIGTDEARTTALCGFYAYLRDAARQQTLGALGAFSALEEVVDTMPLSVLQPIANAYRTIQTPDPFAYQVNRDALQSDADLASEGDTDALFRFAERMNAILLKSDL